ncbi:unnamed protein product [Peniophora sp. CBMAI 1063]|nr:unnamed protein product [Peniophora sp. CBMAI 1063]
MIYSLLKQSLVVLLYGCWARVIDIEDVCRQIQGSVSESSEVFYPGSDGYLRDIEHWSLSSSQNSTCSVEPGTIEDVAIIMKIIGNTRPPFAIKGGGHATNPGFSSTPGVQIAMSRFRDVLLDGSKDTVAVGAGCKWDDAYNALNGTGRIVLGGRVPDIGVAGLTLGGGYAYHTSQYGLAMDNLAAIEIVLPNGTIATVTSADEDLWFALRGAGAANFGIVTTFHFITHPQGDVWGGLVRLDEPQLDAARAATKRFSDYNVDKKASVIYRQDAASGYLILFYDGPTPPTGIFDEFVAIPSAASDLQIRDFASHIQSLAPFAPIEPGTNAFWGSINFVDYPIELQEYIQQISQEETAKLSALDPSFSISWFIEPFSSEYFEDAVDTTPASYPSSRDLALLPTFPYYGFKNASLTKVMLDSMQRTISDVRNKAVELGQDIAHVGEYANYALFTTPTVDIYGTENLARLRKIRDVIDPERVFNLAGGFKLGEDTDGVEVCSAVGDGTAPLEGVQVAFKDSL